MGQRTFAFSLSIALLTLSPELAAQRCSSPVGGADDGDGNMCVNPNAMVTADSGLTGQTGSSYIDRLLDPQLPQHGSSHTGVGTVLTGSGTVALGSGELHLPVELIRLGEVAYGAGLDLTALNRSHFAFADGTTADTDPTGGDLPFGPGWLAPFAEGLMVDAQMNVTRVDGFGARWVLGVPAAVPNQTGWLVYPPENGSRVFVDMNHPQPPRWYREFPDHRRIEYAPNGASTGITHRIQRICRGVLGQTPDWSIEYS